MFFKSPLYFLLFLLLPVIFYLRRRRKTSYIRFSSSVFLKGLNLSVKAVAAKYLFLLRLLAAAFFILALMRLQSPIEGTKIPTEGIDIILTLDVSTSMLAEDFKSGGQRKNRLEVVKEVVRDFIKKRTDDRIGIVAFAGRPYTMCPLTIDYNWLNQSIERTEIGMIEDGTAVGSAVAVSLNRLQNTEAKSKVVILLTDGRNNAGNISPQTAAEAGRALGVKIYTIGAGTTGYAPYPFKDVFGRTVYRDIKIDIDEEMLKDIADKTGGKYFRATDAQSLRQIYQEIDSLEKSVIESQGYLEYNELFYIFAIAGLIVLCLEVVLGNTVFMKLP